MIRVLLADDEPLVRSGIAMLLSTVDDLEVVGEVGDGAAAVAAAVTRRPDVVLMDVRMPQLDGVEATRRITALDPAPAVLMLTSYNADETVYGALGAGASGFLLKHAAPADLPSAVRAVAAGEAWLDPSVARTVVAEFAARHHREAAVPSSVQPLTAREGEVLGLVALGLSNTEVATELVIGEGTVKTHVGHLFTKLGARDRAQLVSMAFRYHLVPS